MARSLVVVGLALALAIPVEAAAPFTAELEAAGSAVLHGTLAGTLQAAGLTHDSRVQDGRPAWSADLSGARIVLRNAGQVVVAGPGHHEVAKPEAPLEDFLYSGPIAFEPAEDVAAAVLPLGDAGGSFTAVLAGTEATLRAAVLPRPDRDRFTPSWEGRSLAPQGPFGTLELQGGPVAATGDLLLVAYGGTLRLGDGRVFETGERPGPGADAGPAQVQDRDRVHALVFARSATLGLDSAAWAWGVRGAAIDVAGQLSVLGATVRSDLGGAHQEAEGVRVDAVGTFTAHAVYRTGATTWRLEGQDAALAFDGQVVAAPGALPWVGVATGVGLAGLAAVALHHLGKLALVAGYARTRPLGSRTRARLLLEVEANPGITRAELARRLGVGKSSVNFHLGILQRAGYVEPHPAGKSVHYQLNHGAFAYTLPTLGRFGPPRLVAAKAALACLAHPSRRRLFGLLGQGLATHAEVAAAWGAPLPAPLFQYHARRLLEAGLAGVTRSGREARWALDVDPAALLGGGAGAVRERLERSGLSPQDLRDLERSLGAPA